jgi:hypothetical protein
MNIHEFLVAFTLNRARTMESFNSRGVVDSGYKAWLAIQEAAEYVDNGDEVGAEAT